jgi:hypothetical protein
MPGKGAQDAQTRLYAVGSVNLGYHVCIKVRPDVDAPASA